MDRPLSPRWYENLEQPPADVQALSARPEVLELIAINLPIDTLLTFYRNNQTMFSQPTFLVNLARKWELPIANPPRSFKEFLRAYDEHYGTPRAFDYPDRLPLEVLLLNAVTRGDLLGVVKGLDLLFEDTLHGYQVKPELLGLGFEQAETFFRSEEDKGFIGIVLWVFNNLAYSQAREEDALVILGRYYFKVGSSPNPSNGNFTPNIMSFSHQLAKQKKYDLALELLSFLVDKTKAYWTITVVAETIMTYAGDSKVDEIFAVLRRLPLATEPQAAKYLVGMYQNSSRLSMQTLGSKLREAFPELEEQLEEATRSSLGWIVPGNNMRA